MRGREIHKTKNGYGYVIPWASVPVLKGFWYVSFKFDERLSQAWFLVILTYSTILTYSDQWFDSLLWIFLLRYNLLVKNCARCWILNLKWDSDNIQKCVLILKLYTYSKVTLCPFFHIRKSNVCWFGYINVLHSCFFVKQM